MDNIGGYCLWQKRLSFGTPCTVEKVRNEPILHVAADCLGGSFESAYRLIDQTIAVS